MMSEDKGDGLRERTKRFGLRVIRLYSALDRGGAGEVIGRQMLRSGTSVGAQYREACRARSTAEFISKVESALQELDETSYWFEMLVESGLMPAAKLNDLQQEAEELLAMLVASVKTAKRR
jgi:four helix bundle protein